jgi:hypothetical protein
VIFVFSFAPVLHKASKGTTFPKISLSFFEGLEYDIAMSVKPMRCSTLANGLAIGLDNCAIKELETKNAIKK